jgi:hypothetical protein
MKLEQFLRENRGELIQRTRAKVASRSSPPCDATELERGVPLFLSQLSATLEAEGTGTRDDDGPRAKSAADSLIEESATVHGRGLLDFGFSIEQVVHDYGDICQAVTELAEERGATLTTGEFHTLNRCLDNAIAGAVSSWSQGRERTLVDEAGKAKESEALKRDLGKLLEQAKTTLDVLRDGRVGIGGATGELLHRCLIDMRALIDGVTCPAVAEAE